MRRFLNGAILCALFLSILSRAFSQGQVVYPPSVYGVTGAGTVELGQRVVLGVSMDLPTGATFQYQWRRASADIPGATQATYVIEAITANDAGTYSVRVTNSAGESVASGSIVVRAAAGPVMVTQPRSLTAQVGQTVIFSYVATGSYPRTHQWFKDGAAIAGATAATLELTNITTASAGAYSVTISNSLGSITSTTALLAVNAATPVVIFSGSPSDGSYTEGTSVQLSVSIQGGSSPYTYQWLKGGVAIEGATSSTLRFNEIAVADAGAYSVRVGNVLGAVTSRTATITVTAAVPPTITRQPAAVAVFESESASFSVSANGTSLRYQWYKDGVAIANATSSGYSIGTVLPTHAGSYTVMVSNIKGSVTSSPAALTIKPAELPAITTQPADVQVIEGQSINSSVTATGSPTLRYQWYINDVAVSGATDRSFSRTASSADSGSFYVVVTNPAGSVKSRVAALTVEALPPPTVATVSVSSSAAVGSSVSVSAEYYSGSATFQWYKDGVPIQGATSRSVELGSVGPDAAGDYFVALSNVGGTTMSRTKRLYLSQSSTPPAGAWLAFERSGDTVYFAFANPARLERYHLPSETWLPTIQLSRAPSAMAIDSSAIYIASGLSVYRYNLQGTGETVVGGGYSSIRGLTLHRGFLLVAYGDSSSLASIRMSDGVQVAQRNYSSYWSGGAMISAPSVGAVFLRGSYYGLGRVVVGADGSLPAQPTFSSTYSYSSNPGSRLYVNPVDSSILDNSGASFRASDLAATPGTVAFDDMVFRPAGDYVALRGGSLYYHDSQGLEVGRVSAGLATARALVAQGDALYSFAPPVSGGSIAVSKASIGPAMSPNVAAPLDGAAVSFTPAATLMDRNGVLLLFSKELRHIFRWSTSERRFLSPIPLQGWPNVIAYSSALQRLYVGYDDSRLLQVALDGPDTTEQSFCVAPRGISNLLVTPNALILGANGDSGWTVHPSTGQTLWRSSSSSFGSGNVFWSSLLNRVYFLSSGSSYPSVMELRPDGSLVGASSRSMSDSTHREPYRLSPDEGTLLTGNGRFYDLSTLAVNNALPHSINDAAWLDRTLYTARMLGAGVNIQRWGGNNYAQDAARVLSGRFIRMWTINAQRLAVITQQSGTAVVTVLDQNLNVVSSDFAGTPTRLANLAARATVGQGDQILIPGFVIGGTQAKRVLIRAAGPALAGFGVTGALTDPTMQVLNAANTVVASNDNWDSAANRAEIASTASTVGAFALAAGSRDAAALVTLPPGAYTVKTSGVGDATGVALVELYDVPETGNNSRLINIAARAQVGTGANMLIPGIVIQGTAPKTVLVRAVGPGLATFGVTGTLANPRLRIYRGETLLHDNDDWGQSQNSSQMIAAAGSVGAFALTPNSRDAALLVTLPPGAYTAQVSGSDGGSGVALVEVYEVNN